MKAEEYITLRHLKLIGFEPIGNGILRRGKNKVWFEKTIAPIHEAIKAELHDGLTLSDLAKEIKTKLNL